MSLIDNVLSNFGYVRYNNGDYFYNISKGNTTYINGIDKLKIALENPVLFAVIEIRAKLLSQAEFYIEGPNGEMITDNPIINLINNPNPHQSKQDFLKQYEWFKSTYGWVFQKPYGSTGFTPTSIFNLKSSNITFPNDMKSSMVWTEKDVKDYYKQTFKYKIQKDNKKIEFKDVIPFYDISNELTDSDTNTLISPSRMDSVIKSVSNIGLSLDAENIMIQQNGREMFFGGQDKGSNLGSSLPMDKGDRKDIESKLINKYGLGRGKIRQIVTNREVGHKSLHVKLSELGLHDSISSNANLVAAAYEVPNEIYKAFMKGATFENQKEALGGFIQSVMQPIANDLANSWTSYFKLDKPIKASFKHLPAMQYLEDKKADKMLKIATSFKYLTDAGLSETQVNNLFQTQGITISE